MNSNTFLFLFSFIKKKKEKKLLIAEKLGLFAIWLVGTAVGWLIIVSSGRDAGQQRINDSYLIMGMLTRGLFDHDLQSKAARCSLNGRKIGSSGTRQAGYQLSII